MASTGGSEGGVSEVLGDLTDDAFLGGALRLLQPARGFRAGTDAILLAASVRATAGEAALELGCGAGAAILALGRRMPGLRLAGLELQPPYAKLARENAARNGMALEVVLGDVAAPPALGWFQHVLMNPPYFDRAASSRAADRGRDIAHGGAHGGDAPLAAWLALAARRLARGGSLTVIQRVARLPELLAGLPATIGSIEVLPLAPRESRAPVTILMRARKGGRAPFRLLAPLAVHAGGGHAEGLGFSAPVRAALFEAAALAWD